MKSLIKKIFLVTFIAVGLFSCSKESLDPVAKQSGDFVLSAPVDGTYTLVATNATTEAFLAQWSAADYGYSASVNYRMEAVKASESFAATGNAYLDLGNFNSAAGIALEKSVTVRQLNTLLLSANGPIGSSQSYKIRIVGKVNNQLATSTNNLADVKSQEATITATAYDAFDEYQKIYAPGNYGGASTFADWAPDNAAKLFSKAGDGNYEGFIWMNNPSPEFKFTPVPAWGDDKGENNPSGAFSGVLGTASNIKAADGAGTYFFTVNWPALTYTMGKRQVGIIGAAVPGTGWGSAQYLTFDTNPASPYFRMYTIDLALLQDEFLIRTKDDWSEKLGSIQSSTETLQATSANKIKFGGQNMKVPAAGNYKVVLDVRNAANYNLRLIPN
jgi:hypothetical protein